MNAPFRTPALAEPAADERAADIARIVDHHGVNRCVDDSLMFRVFKRLGWEMLTDEALAMLADAYEADAAFSEKLNAENRAIAAGRP